MYLICHISKILFVVTLVRCCPKNIILSACHDLLVSNLNFELLNSGFDTEFEFFNVGVTLNGTHY